jgi:cyclopropane-fatty-acyl-phospholipid synthase
MSNPSVSQIRLPQLGGFRFRRDLARQILLRVLGKLETGSLTVHDGLESYHFGNGDDPSQPHAEVHVHDASVYRQILTGGTIASGEAYIRGAWSSPDPVAVTRLFSANMATMASMESGQSALVTMGLKLAHRFNRNTRDGSRKNISAHYDLGNDFFQLFLDPTMMYSSALFTDGDMSLEAASRAKLEEICQQLELKSDDHLLEIGTGWGGMAIYAAQHYGCRVTTTTISREQYEYSRARVADNGLEDRVTVLCEDYRNLTGRYDKLVSIEMIEAVGHEFYSEYFRRCSELLQPEGKMVIQAITMSGTRSISSNAIYFPAAACPR